MDAKMARAKQLGYDVELFTKGLIAAFHELKDSFKLINLDIEEFIPKPFNDLEHLVLDSVFYYAKEIFYIKFYSKEHSSFHYNVEFEEVWHGNIFIPDENGKINEIYSLASPLGIVPTPSHLNLYGVGMAFSLGEFEKAYNDVKNIAYYMLQSQLLYNKGTNSKRDVSYLEAIALEFKILLDTDGLLEKDIELFLNENTEILECTLNIESMIIQPELKNVLELFPHDLRPDLIGFDVFNKRWIILDYKKHEKSLVKNIYKVRLGLRSDANDLENQLSEYRDYFDEEEHRNYFFERYGVTINKPYLIGLLGLIEKDEIQAFNRLMERKVKWFDLYPYNLLLDEFIRKIAMIKKYSLK